MQDMFREGIFRAAETLEVSWRVLVNLSGTVCALCLSPCTGVTGPACTSAPVWLPGQACGVCACVCVCVGGGVGVLERRES